MHERRDRCNNNQHDGGETIQPDRPIGAQRTTFHPPKDQQVLCLTGIQAKKNNPAQTRRKKQQSGCHPLGSFFTDHAPAKAANHCPNKRSKKDNLCQHNAYPFITFTSSTAIVPRFRKKLTRIARPMAASAAATVRTKSVNTCPTRSCAKLEKATRLILTESKISSTDINKMIIFFTRI